MVAGGGHADHIGRPVGSGIENRLHHVALAQRDRGLPVWRAVVLQFGRIAADMQQPLLDIRAGQHMGKAHDGIDRGGRRRRAVDWDQDALEMNLAAQGIDEAARVFRHEQGRRFGVARQFLGGRAAQPARHAVAAFGGEHDQIGRVLVDKFQNAVDRRLRFKFDLGDGDAELCRYRGGRVGCLRQTPAGKRHADMRECGPFHGLAAGGDMDQSQPAFGVERDAQGMDEGLCAGIGKIGRMDDGA